MAKTGTRKRKSAASVSPLEFRDNTFESATDAIQARVPIGTVAEHFNVPEICVKRARTRYGVATGSGKMAEWYEGRHERDVAAERIECACDRL